MRHQKNVAVPYFFHSFHFTKFRDISELLSFKSFHRYHHSHFLSGDNNSIDYGAKEGSTEKKSGKE